MGFDKGSLDGLGVLGAVVEAGSFVRAGEALGLTQSAVSRVVARLESRIGVRIFRRTARSISLTDEGARFYESVAPHLAAIVDATIEASGTARRIRGRLRVNVDGGIGQFVLTPRLQPFLAQHPDLAVEIAVRDRMGDLVRDGFDVSVRCGLAEPSALKAHLLMRTRVVTCASPDYLASHGIPRRPRDLEKHQCVLMRNPSTVRHLYARPPVRRTARSGASGVGRGDVSLLRVPSPSSTPVGQGSRLPGFRRRADAPGFSDPGGAGAPTGEVVAGDSRAIPLHSSSYSTASTSTSSAPRSRSPAPAAVGSTRPAPPRQTA